MFVSDNYRQSIYGAQGCGTSPLTRAFWYYNTITTTAPSLLNFSYEANALYSENASIFSPNCVMDVHLRHVQILCCLRLAPHFDILSHLLSQSIYRRCRVAGRQEREDARVDYSEAVYSVDSCSCVYYGHAVITRSHCNRWLARASNTKGRLGRWFNSDQIKSECPASGVV